MKATEKTLSKNFNLSEFLRSKTYPDLKYYQPSSQELANVQALVDNVLQPLRDKFGAVTITSGARPQNLEVSPGITLDEALQKAGYHPAEHSDHHEMAAADFVLRDMGKMQEAYDYLKSNPSVRQVILYVDKDGKPTHLHVAVIRPDKPKEPQAVFAFVQRPDGVALS